MGAPWDPEGPVEPHLGHGMFNFVLLALKEVSDLFVSCDEVGRIVAEQIFD